MATVETPEITSRTPANEHAYGLFEAAYGLGREAKLIGYGVGAAVSETIANPADKAPELVLSATTGAVLGAINRLGTPGKVVTAGAGGAMLLKLGYDEWTGNRWNTFGKAVVDTWHSEKNLASNIAASKDSLGNFIVDMGVGAAGMKIAGAATSRFTPPNRTLAYAIRRADRDNGMALLKLQDRWEDPARFKQAIDNKLELTAHSQPAVPGEARGDLIRVLRGPDGRIQLYSMDSFDHGVESAKFAGTLHSAIDDVVPRTGSRSASQIFRLIDNRLGKTETAATGALSIYNPLTHELQTATAGSQFAYVIRAGGKVEQLDKKIGGYILGQKSYSNVPRGTGVTRLESGDTVVMASDGAFERFRVDGGSVNGFERFLQKMGPNPGKIKQGILKAAPPDTGVDDTSFVIFRRSV